MDCKACDRCGKIYLEDFEKYQNGSYIITTAPPASKSRWTYMGDNIVFRDICENCKRSFEEWWMDGHFGGNGKTFWVQQEEQKGGKT